MSVEKATLSRVLGFTLAIGAAFVLTAWDGDTRVQAQAKPAAGNPISGVGMPNPNPKVTQNWGELPAGRTWGTSAGLDIDPKDGHVWGYERCGAGHGRRRPG